jgi:hypothetical protein
MLSLRRYPISISIYRPCDACLFLLALRPLLLHALATNKISRLLLHSSEPLARVAVLAGFLHRVDSDRFVF